MELCDTFLTNKKDYVASLDKQVKFKHKISKLDHEFESK